MGSVYPDQDFTFNLPRAFGGSGGGRQTIRKRIEERNMGWFRRQGKRYLGSQMHKTGASWFKFELGIGKEFKEFAKKSPKLGFISKWGGRAFVGHAIYQGYKEGGVVGAAIGGVQSYLIGSAIGAAKTAAAAAAPFALPVLAAATVAAGIGYAYTGTTPWQFAARPYVRDHMKKHAKLEMVAPVNDQFGILSTMRQRSVAAIQGSHINARSALGHEAMSMYRPYSSILR